MTRADFATTGTHGQINKAETKKAVLAFLFLFVAMAMASTFDVSGLFGKTNIAGGTNYEIKAGQTRIGIYNLNGWLSQYAGNKNLGYTIGVDSAGVYGSFHTSNKCFGSCDE